MPSRDPSLDLMEGTSRWTVRKTLISGRAKRPAAFCGLRPCLLARCGGRSPASCPEDAYYAAALRVSPGRLTHFVDEIGHADFGLRPGNAGGAHEEAHPRLLYQ